MPPPSGPPRTLQLLSCFLLVSIAWTFNIQADSALVIKGEAGSRFGFDVALWTQGEENRLVIGAPADLVDTGEGEGQARSGRVFIYQQEENYVKNLKNITFLPVHGEADPAGMQHGIGFGTKIAAGVTDRSPLLMCAPRTSFFYKRGTAESRVPIGECLLVLDGDVTGKHVSPKGAFEDLSDAVQYCGFSAVFGKNDSAVFLGCPSIIKENQGHILEYDLHAKWAKENLTRACERTTEGGWGLAEGTWLPKGGRGLVAACGNLGKVVRLDEALALETKLQERATSRLGEMAGSSLAACDVDGDGRDEVAVAAPFGRVPDAFGSYKEVGRVTVLGAKGYNVTLHGHSAFGRFGSSVVCLGDVNNDSFSDLAVGASEHPGGGAVFVFLGSSEGLVPTPSQILLAPPNVTGFGFSLAGGRDIDGNGYPDVLVGAPLSDSAVTFRAAPVPKLRVSTFRFDPPAVDLRQKDCDLLGGRLNCFRLLLEVRDEGGHQRESPLKLRVKVNLDSGRRRKRIHFYDNTSSVDMSLDISGNLSKVFEVYAEDLANETDAIPGPIATVNVSLEPHRSVSKGGLLPVIGKAIINTTSLILQCGNDTNNCVAVTDMAFFAEEREINFTVGERYASVEFNVTVTGGNAYDPYISVMDTVGLTAQMGRSSNSPISLDCFRRRRCKFTTMKIRPGTEMIMMLRFEQDVKALLDFMNQTSVVPPSINLDMAGMCVNDKNASNDFLTFKMFPKLRPVLSLVGENEDESISITFADGKGAARVEKNDISFDDENFTVTHNYTLRNVGLFPIQKIAVTCSGKITGIENETLTEYVLSFDPPPEDSGTCEAPCISEVYNLAAEKMVKIVLIFANKELNQQHLGQHSINLTSTCRAKVISPSGATVVSEVSDVDQTVTLTTYVIFIVSEGKAGPDSWVIALAMLGGCFLLALLVLALYKLGFFKRKLPPAPPQGSPAPPTPATESEVEEIS